MAVTSDKPAPYAPASAILEIITRYRSRGLIFPISAEVLARAGISESLISRTLQALETLDLFKEDGNPTETLEAIRLAPEAEYKKRIEDWLKSAYAEVFAFVDPSVDDETRIRDAFRSYNPIGQQNRMVTLFQGLCAAAGLIQDKAIPASRSRSASSAPRPRPAPAPPRGVSVKTPSAKPVAHAQGQEPLPPPLAGLLESLPKNGKGWCQSTRDRFVTTFEAVLDFCVPIIEAPDDETQNNNQTA